MDRYVIEEKLESLRRCVRRIEEKRPEHVQALEEDWDVQDILTLNVTRAVQLCVDIATHIVADAETPPPDTMAASFDTLHRLKVLPAELAERLKSAVGFRNVAIHEYRSVDWKVVHAICHQHLSDFRRFAKCVERLLDQQEH